MNIKVHQFLEPRLGEHTISIERVPNRDEFIRVLSSGCILSRPYMINGEKYWIDFHTYRGRVVVLNRENKSWWVKCIASWAPIHIPTQRDADYIVRACRAHELLREQPDDRTLSEPFSFRFDRKCEWYVVFWQVACLPMCDDLKRLVVYCLIDV